MNDNSQDILHTKQKAGTEQDLASVMAHILQKFDNSSYSFTREIMRIWLEINGDRERRHTKGVFLLEKEELKTLLVYVDSPSIVQDFSMNKHLYLGRFTMTDIRIDDIQFRLSRYVDTPDHVSTAVNSNNSPTTHNSTQSPTTHSAQNTTHEISEEEKQYILELCSTLPEKLQEVVSNALISMKINQQEENTNNN